MFTLSHLANFYLTERVLTNCLNENKNVEMLSDLDHPT